MATEKEISKLIITLEGQVKNLKKEFGIADEETKKFAKKQKKLLTGLKQNWLLYTAAIYGISRVIKSIAAPFAAFTHKMLEVKTLTNLSTKAFENLSKTILNMTRRVPQSAKELADALYDIVSAGVEVGKSAAVLELSAKAAVAGVTNTKTAARTGLAVINAYGKSINELGNVYDILFKTIKEGVLTFDTLSGAIGQVLPAAVAANVEFKDIAASMAAMTKVGIGTNRAATALRAGLIALAAPTDEARETMKRMGIVWKGWIPTLKQIHEKGLDLKQMRQLIPDIRAGQAIIALSQNFKTLVSTIGEMERSEGAMQSAFDMMKDSPVNQVKMLSNVLDELKISISALFAPAILWTMRQMTRYFQTWRMISEGLSTETMRTFFLIQDTLPKIEGRQRKLNFVFNERAKVLAEINEIETLRAHRFGLAYTKKETEDLKQLNKQSELWRGELLKLSDTVAGVTKVTDGDTDSKDKNVGATKVQAESIKIFNAEIKQSLVLLKTAIDDNTISVKEYYDQKKLLLEEVYFEEVRVLNDLLNKTTDLTDQEKIRQEITVKGIQLETDLMKLEQERIKSLETYAEKQKEVNDLLSGIEARTTTKAEYAQELADLQEKQRQELEFIKNKELEKDDYIKAIMKARSLWELELKRLQLDQEKRIEEKRYEMLASSFNNISNAFREMATQEGYYIKELFILSRAAALAEAFVNYNLAMTKIDAQLGAYSGFAKVAAAISLGTNIGAIAASTITAFAEGGQVHGEKGKDKISARLTDREFVHPVSSVDYYGTGVMEAIRRKSIPKGLLTGYSSLTPRIPSGHFQEGGLARGSGVDEGTPVNITNIVDPSLLGNYLNGKQGQGMIVNVISENAYRIKRILKV